MKKLYTDGYIIPKRGGGYRVTDAAGNLLAHGHTERDITANEAELRGIAHALRLAGTEDIVSSDSSCAIAWTKKANPKERPDLKPIADEAYLALHRKHAVLIWEPREVNLAGLLNEELRQKRLKVEKKALKPQQASEKLKEASKVLAWKVPVFPVKAQPLARDYKTQNEHLGNALRKRADGVELIIEERIALEAYCF